MCEGSEEQQEYRREPGVLQVFHEFRKLHEGKLVVALQFADNIFHASPNTHGEKIPSKL